MLSASTYKTKLSDPVVRLAKWGNSIGVRIPKHVVKALGLAAGHSLKIRIEGNCIVFCPIRKYSLVELVSKITDENKHEEIDWGSDEGAERW